MSNITRRRRLRTASVGGAAAILATAGWALTGATAHAAPVTQHYTTQGAASFTVPAGICSLGLVGIGAKGGAGNTPTGAQPGGSGGRGAVVSASVAVTPGDVLDVFVGGPAKAATTRPRAPAASAVAVARAVSEAVAATVVEVARVSSDCQGLP